MCFALGTVYWARQEDGDRPCLDTHDKFFFKTLHFLNSYKSYFVKLNKSFIKRFFGVDKTFKL